MAELLAQGKETTQRWRHELPIAPVTLGRTADSSWQVPWDRKISRVHAALHWQNGVLVVRRLPISLNPIFFQGSPREEFQVPPGGRFVIGDTTFQVVGEVQPTAPDMPLPSNELTCSSEELRQYKYVDADERIEVLAALPGVIRFSPSEAELENQVVGVLLRGILRAQEAAVVGLRLQPGGDPAIEVHLVKSRVGLVGNFRASRRLVLEALQNRRQSVMHIWPRGEASPEFTARPGCDWAICAPLAGDTPPPEGTSSSTGPPAARLGLYLTGNLPTGQVFGPNLDGMLKSDLKFTELVADIFASVRQMGDLQRRLGQLKTFLPRPVLHVMAGMGDKEREDFLRPRQATVTVLFCDLRDSTGIGEMGQHDLLRLWDHVSAALGVMSSSILDQEGVIADFQGDAIMAFWGWPLENGQSMDRAFRAALTICQRLGRLPATMALPAFRCGIGIAHGPALVGRLGTPEQYKIGVFGPTVNLASRLETLCKRLGVAIVLDESCAGRLGASSCRPGTRVRRLARVRPKGMDRQLMVTELVPDAPEGAPAVEGDFNAYEDALDAFLQGQWTEARARLTQLPQDGPSKFLLKYLDANPHGPPANWDGVIALDTK